MALYISLNKLCQCLRRSLTTGIPNLKNNSKIHDRILDIKVDSLDDFTTQLLEKKVEKWCTQKTFTKELLPDIKYENMCNKFSVNKVNSLFKEAIDNSDNSYVIELTQQCIMHKVCPSTSYLLYSLSICSQNGYINIIKQIQDLCKCTNTEILNQNSNFQHYIAEAIWIKGNIHEAVTIFKEVYKENCYLRRRIRLMLKNLITDHLKDRSEAVLVVLTKFAENLATEHKDFYPITCIWQICFLSEWFTDQCLALQLMNKYKELRKAVIIRIPYVVNISLNNHRTEVVYRLLEALLKFEMKMQYRQVLLSLLEYQIIQKDIRRCIEIIKWSQDNDVEFLPVHYQKYLKLLISYKGEKLILRKQKSVIHSKPKTHFKF